MKRTMLLLSIFLLATPISGWVNLAEAQQPPKVPRMGFLRFHSPPIRNLEAFKQGLRGLGYEEGKNIVIEYRYAEGKKGRLPGLAAELVRLKVDVIAGIAAHQIEALTFVVIPVTAHNSPTTNTAYTVIPGEFLSGIEPPQHRPPRRPNGD